MSTSLPVTSHAGSSVVIEAPSPARSRNAPTVMSVSSSGIDQPSTASWRASSHVPPHHVSSSCRPSPWMVSGACAVSRKSRHDSIGGKEVMP
jgi:hypothetical protein